MPRWCRWSRNLTLRTAALYFTHIAGPCRPLKESDSFVSHWHCALHPTRLHTVNMRYAELDKWNETPLWTQTSPWILTTSFQSQMGPQRGLVGTPQIQLGPIVGLICSHRIWGQIGARAADLPTAARLRIRLDIVRSCDGKTSLSLCAPARSLETTVGRAVQALGLLSHPRVSVVSACDSQASLGAE